jgi:hypothetical protein
LTTFGFICAVCQTAPEKPPAITHELLEARLSELKAAKEQAIANALAGAIQECEHWLELLKATEKDSKKDEPKKGGAN